jgi:hypothetical protein
MRPSLIARAVGLIILPGVLAGSIPVATSLRGLQSATAACQDGTCCPEQGSTCVVGNNQRPERYYKPSGSCTEPSQPAPPP